ncbi:MAG: hypothetical protein OEZ65_08935 [Gemmatimonadota bacterium]|nr:hypothetical protein [Gemmatimonadota bacterium]
MRQYPFWAGRPVMGALAAVLVLAPGCTTHVVQSGESAAMAAQLSVERFLQAANVRDVETMGRIFGTSDGPIINTGSTLGCAFKKIGSWFGGESCVKRQEVEIRLDAIAQLLVHEDYLIRREESVAGRTSPTRRVLVDITRNGETVAGVPFMVVRDSNGRWLVNEIDLEMVASGR